MFLDFAKKNQITFQDPASPLAEGIIDLHNGIFFWLIFIFIPVLVIFIRILTKSNDIWLNPSLDGIKKRNVSILFSKIVHGTIIEIIWTITPTIILILIAIPSFGLIYAMDTIIDPDWTIKIIGNQWYWAYDYNFSAFLLGDIEELFIASKIALSKNNDSSSLVQNLLPTQINEIKFKKMVVENTFKLYSHNIKHYVFDSYTITESSLEKGAKGIRLLSVDNPLVFPINQNIRCLISSVDVLHSFAVPSLGVKMDATPGRLSAVAIFVERPGQFFGQCSELCGVQHGYMSIEIYAI